MNARMSSGAVWSANMVFGGALYVAASLGNASPYDGGRNPSAFVDWTNAGWRNDFGQLNTNSITRFETEEVVDFVPSSTHYDLLNEIDRAALLADGWDGRDGIAPSRDAVESASVFVRMLPDTVDTPRPLIAGDGEVGVYWKRGKAYIEVGFCGDGNIVFYAGDASGEALASGDMWFDGKAVPSDLLDAIKQFSQSA